MGKGDKRRPLQVDPERFAERWERTFGPVVRGMEADGRVEREQQDKRESSQKDGS